MQLETTVQGERHGTITTLRVELLGGFAVARDGISVPDFAWQRRSARRLTKLLATVPNHALHREQIIDIFWPNADVDSARNSLAKALHAARRAVEPERPAREESSYLSVRDDLVALNPDHVLVDADEFQHAAHVALRLGTIEAFDAALRTYTGALLPEDLYEDWPSNRRLYLAELHVRLLLGLADSLAEAGAHAEAVDRLQTALLQDPTREDVHRQVMRLYAEMGARGLAIRQFQICSAHLGDELGTTPEHETTSLYEDLVTDRVHGAEQAPESGRSSTAFLARRA